MRIAHIFFELKYSGAELMYTNAAKLFKESGCELYAIAIGPTLGEFADEFVKSGFKIIHLPAPSDKNIFSEFNRFYRIVDTYLGENKIDVVHIHTTAFSWLISYIAWKRNIRIVRTFHNRFQHRPYTWLKGYFERFTSRKWFHVVQHTIGETVYDNELNYYKNPSVRVNNWFDPEKFYPAIDQFEKQKLREKLGLPLDKWLVISVGGCSIVKNHHAVIQALGELRDINCSYIHLGCGNTEEQEKQLAIDLGLSSQVNFCGNKLNVREYLVASDVFVMPSIYEGLGNSGLEAMACGLPVIFYDVPGLRDLVKSNQTGLLISPDVKTLQEKLRYLATNTSIAAKMGRKAASHVQEYFSQQAGVIGILSLYKGV